jgi:hypothetical protein
LTGNPVFPFLNGYFRSPLWYPENETFVWHQFGLGKGLFAAVKLPWKLTFDTGRFGEVVNGAVGILYLALVPAAIVLRRRLRPISVILVPTLVFCLFWFFSVQYLRYFLPALFGLAILAGVGLVEWGERLRTGVRQLVWAIPLFAVLSASLGLIVSLSQYWNIPTRIPYDVTIGRMSREDYRARCIHSYKTFIYANQHLKPGDLIYGVAEFFQYLSEFPLWTPFYSMEGNRILRADSEESLLKELRSTGITHLIINFPAVRNDNWQFLVHGDTFLERNAILMHASNNVYLYRLLKPGESVEEAMPSRQVLQNPNFECLTKIGQPCNWRPSGGAVVGEDPAVAGAGGKALQLTDKDAYFQDVAVSAGSLYTCIVTARSLLVDPAHPKIQIAWLDEKGKALEYSIVVDQVRDQPRKIRLVATAPANSKRASVCLAVYRGKASLGQAALLQQVKDEPASGRP